MMGMINRFHGIKAIVDPKERCDAAFEALLLALHDIYDASAYSGDEKKRYEDYAKGQTGGDAG